MIHMILKVKDLSILTSAVTFTASFYLLFFCYLLCAEPKKITTKKEKKFTCPYSIYLNSLSKLNLCIDKIH